MAQLSFFDFLNKCIKNIGIVSEFNRIHGISLDEFIAGNPIVCPVDVATGYQEVRNAQPHEYMKKFVDYVHDSVWLHLPLSYSPEVQLAVISNTLSDLGVSFNVDNEVYMSYEAVAANMPLVGFASQVLYIAEHGRKHGVTLSLRQGFEEHHFRRVLKDKMDDLQIDRFLVNMKA